MLELECRRVSLKKDDSWEAVTSAFSRSPECCMGQEWLVNRHPKFRPAVVRAGWADGELLVYAEMDDDDPFNPMVEFNGMLYEHGDVFEIFLRPEDQDAYFEFHIGPENQKFQLRIPSRNAFAEARQNHGIPPDWFVWKPVIFSRVIVEPAGRRWKVLCAIPFGLVAEKSVPAPGSRWRFSFSRYDYTRGQKNPVHSSTSPHKKLNFHIQEDWGTLIFS